MHKNKQRELGKIREQRNTCQKNHKTNSKKKISKVKISNKPNEECKLMIIKMLNECMRRM